MPAYGLTFTGESHGDHPEGEMLPPCDKSCEFQFHSDIVLGDGSSLLLNKRGVEYLYKSRREHVDRLAKFDKDWESWNAKNDIEYSKLEGKVGMKVWAPVKLRNLHGAWVDMNPDFKCADGIYHQATILKLLENHWTTHCILVEFRGGFKQEVHISDLRMSPPPPRGRGGDKRKMVMNPLIWAAPFRIPREEHVDVVYEEYWQPGQKVMKTFGWNCMVNFTVPENVEGLPLNNENPPRRYFKVKLPVPSQKEYDIKGKWDEANSKLNETERSMKNTATDGVKYKESPYPHYLCKVMKVNDNGTIEVRWANGYIDKEYNPENVTEDQLDLINYRVPRNGAPYNPPELDVGEQVYVDRDRKGKYEPVKICAQLTDGTYLISEKDASEAGDEDLEYVAHDLLHRGFDPKWNMDLRNGPIMYPEVDPNAEKAIHQDVSGDTHPNHGWKSSYKRASKEIRDDGGILAWCKWLKKESPPMTESGDIPQDIIIPYCLGKIESRGGSFHDPEKDDLRPAIFRWSFTEKSAYWKTRLKWIHVETIRKDDVHGIPLLEAIYNKVIKENGMEDGNGDLFALELMKFSEGRKKNTVRRWRPQQFQEEAIEDSEEEKRFNTLLSVNVSFEKKNIELEKQILGLKEEIEGLKSKDVLKESDEIKKLNERIRFMETENKFIRTDIKEIELSQFRERLKTKEMIEDACRNQAIPLSTHVFSSMLGIVIFSSLMKIFM